MTRSWFLHPLPTRFRKKLEYDEEHLRFANITDRLLAVDERTYAPHVDDLHNHHSEGWPQRRDVLLPATPATGRNLHLDILLTGSHMIKVKLSIDLRTTPLDKRNQC